MRCGLGQFHKPSPEFLKFAKEYGATDILLNQNSDKDNHLLDHNNRWELKDLVSLRRTVESYGMKLSALENVPTKFYDHIMLGGPKRDEQIENMIYTIKILPEREFQYLVTTGCHLRSGELSQNI